jgi:hypothetical protein
MAEWTAPRELAQSLPRSVETTLAFKLAIAFISVACAFELRWAIEAYGDPGRRLLFTIQAVVFGIPFAVGVVRLLLNYRREKWLVSWGRAAEATIFSETRSLVGGDDVFPAQVLRYRFKDENGETVETRERRWPPWKIGETSATVLHEPGNPRNRTLYPTRYVVSRLT